ncbi:MAG: protein-glutamate O-methyltransferase CheR [Oscillospiraceae bacterium]|jgi:chemotaxis protein methyltransferase CheR|nr:protein-glutamate O-methyltransferase CheR [Oscillospiraceae bacterium]
MIIPPKLSDADFKRLTDFVLKKYGINLTQKKILVEGRLASTIKQRGFDSFTAFIDMIFADRTGTEMINLLNKLTTNHTFFLREKEHYDFMKDVALPYIEKTKKDHKVNIWSAACSSGEEPYTNVMALLEYFGHKSAQWKIEHLATDISERVMSKAKEAIYHVDSMKNLPDTWKRKYFTAVENSCFKVSPEVTKRVTFKTFNLMDPVPFKSYPYDIIFCRNVMIYFEHNTKIEVVKRLYEALAPGGYLFIGHAESITRDTTQYKFIKPAIYRRPLPGE